MKQLKDGGLGFYQPAWMTIVPLIIMAGVFCIFWGEAKGWVAHLLISVFFLIVFILLIFQGRKPICILYPHRLCVGKKSYLWPQLTACYLQKRMVRRGKNSTPRKTLVFESNGQEALVLELWELLSKDDRQKLLAEISLRGISQQPEKAPEHWFLKTVDFFNGKKK